MADDTISPGHGVTRHRRAVIQRIGTRVLWVTIGGHRILGYQPSRVVRMRATAALRARQRWNRKRRSR